MNRQADADELNIEIESLLACGKVETQGNWRALAALAAGLRGSSESRVQKAAEGRTAGRIPCGRWPRNRIRASHRRGCIR